MASAPGCLATSCAMGEEGGANHDSQVCCHHQVVFWGLKVVLGLGLGEECIWSMPLGPHHLLPLALRHTPWTSFWAQNAFWAARGAGSAQG